jgi:transposase
VLQRLQDDNLSYRQAAALFDIRRFDIIGHWKRRYGEDGVKALALGAAGENRIMKKQPDQKSEPQLSDDQRSREQLLDELNYLRMENAYLKKLEALAQAKKQAIQRKKR